MKKRKLTISPATLTVLILTLSLLLITSFAVLIINNEKDDGDKVDPNKTVSFPSVSSIEINDREYLIEYEIQHLNDTYTENDEELISSYASYPVISGVSDIITDKINAYISEFVSENVKISEYDITSAQDDVRWAQSQELPFYPHEFTLSSRIVYHKNGFLSVLFEDVVAKGLNDPSEKLISLCFDLTTGELADFSDFLGSTDEFAAMYVANLFTQLIDIEPSRFYLDAKNYIYDVISLLNFYLTDNGVVIYIEADVISPSVYGVPSFIIPYSELGL